MMDTILNLGLNDTTVQGVIAQTGNPRFAYDCYRRFVSMYGDVVLGCKPEDKDEIDPFEEILDEMKQAKGVALSTPTSTPTTSRSWSRRSRRRSRSAPATTSPTTRGQQLWGAISAVFGSLGQRPRRRLPPPLRHPRRVGHRGQRPGDGLRQHRRRVRHRRRLHPRPRDRRERLLRRVPRQRPGRGRGRRRAHAAPGRASWPTCSRPRTPSCSRCARRSSASSATCRTSSSRSRRAASTCCRRATASAPGSPPSASPWTWSKRG